MPWFLFPISERGQQTIQENQDFTSSNSLPPHCTRARWDLLHLVATT